MTGLVVKIIHFGIVEAAIFDPLLLYYGLLHSYHRRLVSGDTYLR
jgi:hypothetical protein